jgi:hypothetical protein
LHIPSELQVSIDPAPSLRGSPGTNL